MRARLVTSVAAGIVAMVLVGSAAARGKSRECKPSGLPNLLGEVGAVEVAQPVDYWSEPYLLVTDKAVKPDKVRLVGANGRLIEIGKQPATVEPAQWLARGRAVYALGRGRSQTAGKTDVVLMRWGSDPRPRLSVLQTADTVEGQLSAAFVNEFLAVSWAAAGGDGKLHRMIGFVDTEDFKLPVAQDLGLDRGGAARVQPLGKGFAVTWTTADGIKQAAFDLWGKPSAPPTASAWSNAAALRGAMVCEARSWFVHESGAELVVSSAEAGGSIREVTKLASAGKDSVAMQCVDDGVAIGRRTLDAKAGNVIFWVSTVDGRGNVRERRIKDMRGSADDIRMPQFTLIGAKLLGYWVEGQGDAAKVWSREIRCE